MTCLEAAISLFSAAASHAVDIGTRAANGYSPQTQTSESVNADQSGHCSSMSMTSVGYASGAVYGCSLQQRLTLYTVRELCQTLFKWVFHDLATRAIDGVVRELPVRRRDAPANVFTATPVLSTLSCTQLMVRAVLGCVRVEISAESYTHHLVRAGRALASLASSAAVARRTALTHTLGASSVHLFSSAEPGIAGSADFSSRLLPRQHHQHQQHQLQFTYEPWTVVLSLSALFDMRTDVSRLINTGTATAATAFTACTNYGSAATESGLAAAAHNLQSGFKKLFKMMLAMQRSRGSARVTSAKTQRSRKAAKTSEKHGYEDENENLDPQSSTQKPSQRSSAQRNDSYASQTHYSQSAEECGANEAADAPTMVVLLGDMLSAFSSLAPSLDGPSQAPLVDPRRAITDYFLKECEQQIADPSPALTAVLTQLLLTHCPESIADRLNRAALVAQLIERVAKTREEYDRWDEFENQEEYDGRVPSEDSTCAIVCTKTLHIAAATLVGVLDRALGESDQLLKVSTLCMCVCVYQHYQHYLFRLTCKTMF